MFSTVTSVNTKKAGDLKYLEQVNTICKIKIKAATY